MTKSKEPAVAMTRSPRRRSPENAESGVRAGSADKEEMRDGEGMASKKAKSKKGIPLLQSKEAEEEELMEGKEDGAGCTKCSKKKKRKMDMKKCDGLTPSVVNDACWKNYEQRGTKMKGGKEVPNCVPKGSKKRTDLKCGKGAISKGEKCTKGAATQAKGGLGSRFGGGFGGTAKAVGLGALETVKWTSGYNLGKQIASSTSPWRGGANEAKKKSGVEKAAGTLTAGFLLGPQAALGAARRYGLFGESDLDTDKRFRRRGDGGSYAKGFMFDGKALHMK